MASSMNFKFPQFSTISFESLVPNACPEGIALLTETLYWNPSKRPTTSQALRSGYFKNQPNKDMAMRGSNASQHQQQQQSFVQSRHNNSSSSIKQQLTNHNHNQYVSNDHHSVATHRTKKHSDSDGYNGSSNYQSGHFNADEVFGDDDYRVHETSTSSKIKASSSFTNLKDQYLNRSRYIAGQSSSLNRSSSFRTSGQL